MIASAMAVELLVSIIQHPLRKNDENELQAQTCLGIVPHTIRGFLGRYSTILPSGEGFSQCVACSSK
ncbi:unnamed protein product, partial [Didymodactylos carnosus]